MDKLDASILKKPSSLRSIAAALLLLIAAWEAWQGWQIHAANQLAEATAAARVQVAQQIQPLLDAALKNLDTARTRVALISAVKRNDLTTAKDLVSDGWPDAKAVEFIAPDLSLPYADPATFGYGKLGLLEQALLAGRSVVAVVRDAGSPQLALAAPVQDTGLNLTLLYVRVPLAPIVAPAASAAPKGAYLALRQGHYDVAESGDKTGLDFKAEVDAITLGDTPLRVVAAAPDAPTGLFGQAGLGEFGVAGLLFLVAGGLWLLPRLRKGAGGPAMGASAPAETGPLTLAELQSSGQLATAKTEPTAAVRVTSKLPATPQIAVDRSIFRAYDIRGIVGQTLDVNIARLIGQAIGSLMQERNQRNIVVGRDGRLSSPSLADALIEGLRKAGRDVIDIGEAPTPMAYFGTFQLRTGCCVSLTGSHNPPDYNGFKIMVDGETLYGDAIQNLYSRIVENKLYKAETPGQSSVRSLKDDYIQRIAGDIQIERKLKVVIDCGNGVAGAIAPELLEAIGAEVEPLFCEVDGTFPHHHPDPSDPDNLVDLIRVVQKVGADIGLALDGDGDRLGVVTKSGEMIYPDRLLMLFAADVLERNPGACVIYDVKCTGNLATQILRNGGSPLMWKTGHSLIKAKMKETEAELAGEMSGHFFFRERWYGFDDGLYAAARLLEILAASPDDVETVFAALPKGVSTPELKISVAEGEQYKFIENFVAKAKFEGARIATIDGLRADWPDGWGLVRASNTTPTLVMRFDAKDAAALARVEGLFREQMLAVDPNLTLPF
jgi:phosphomannomutase/phosphoglucomutase